MHFKTTLSTKTHFNIVPSKLLPPKMHAEIAITKIFYINASINAVRGKINTIRLLLLLKHLTFSNLIIRLTVRSIIKSIV